MSRSSVRLNSDDVALREFLAQAMFKGARPYASWDALRESMKRVWLYKVDKILKESGYENAKLVKQRSPLVVADMVVEQGD